MKRFVEEVFVTQGVPQFTFVQPPNYNEILLDIRTPGKPVIIEGQSGTGKTTCVRKILDSLGHSFEDAYLTARNASNVNTIEQLMTDLPPRTFVIDDFHRLPENMQERLADIAKMVADQSGQGRALPKLVLIGINQIGSALIQLVPDVAKRMGIHRIKAGTAEQIATLVTSGCEALNISIDNRDIVYAESKGDYWLAQQLCQSICTMNNVLETVDPRSAITFDLSDLRRKVVDKVREAYYPAVKEFCRGRRFRPTNDPYYKLLRAVGQQESSIVDLNALSNAREDVRGSINNIKEHRLQVLLESKPMCGRYFYYNQETKNFAVEDPALSYFLKHLDWTALRLDCGFREEDRDYEYDVALSFAGTNRELAAELAEQLESLDIHVFYDAYFEANFLGSAWSSKFKDIFSKDSRLVICLLDVHHLSRLWPTFEREHFSSRVNDGEVIPIYLDDTIFVGIPRDVVGIRFSWDKNSPTWRDKVTDEIVWKVTERLNLS